MESSSANQKQIRTIKTQYNLIQHMETLCESLQKDALTQSWKLFTVVQSQRRFEFDTILFCCRNLSVRFFTRLFYPRKYGTKRVFKPTNAQLCRDVSRETRHKTNEILFQNLNFLKCDELFFRCDEVFFLEGQRNITKK